MNTKIIVKLISICLGTSLLFAQTAQGDEAEDKACGGYARAGYIKTDVDNNSDESATAIGGEFGCKVDLNENINIKLGVSTSLDPGINTGNDDSLHGDFFDEDKDSYAMLGEASLNLNYGDFESRLGRQIFDSPHMDSDDLRMIPNRFEAYQINYGLNENIDLGLAYVTKMSGWENGIDQADFVDVGEAYGADDGDAYVAWVAYEQDGLALQGWGYSLEDIANIFYAEAIYGADFSDNISWEVGLQYDHGSETGSDELGEIDADTWGVSAAITNQYFTVSAAYNRNSGDRGALASLGGGPFFTSMEDQTLDAVEGDDARAAVLGIEGEVWEGLTIGFAASEFRASSKNDYHVKENNFYMNYEWNEAFLVEAMYADIDDKNSSDDTDQVRVILTYQFDGPF
jgi:outer membrane OprD family porin